MRKIASGGAAVASRAKQGLPAMPALPDMPEPDKAHEWLSRLVGRWNAEVEAYFEPGKPPVRSGGTERVRAIGGFWIVADYKGTFMDRPFTGLLTLGYDSGTKKYIGSWVGSLDSHLWQYEGTLNASGTILTLETEGECPTRPGRLSKFRETIEFKGKDHRRFISSMLGDDGKWFTSMIIDYKRLL